MDHVKSGGPGLDHRLLHIRKLVLEQQPHARHEVVRLAELGDTLSGPGAPAIGNGARNNVIVLL